MLYRVAAELVVGTITRGRAATAATTGADTATTRARDMAWATTPTTMPLRGLVGVTTPVTTPPLDLPHPTIVFGANSTRNRAMRSWTVGTVMTKIIFMMLAM